MERFLPVTLLAVVDQTYLLICVVVNYCSHNITFLHNNTVEHISKAVSDSLHLKIGDLFDKETYSTCSAIA